MCGIAGCIGATDPMSVRRMTDALAHRGPDGSGIEIVPEIPATIGHTRLSIIDLTPSGHQPMARCDGRLWITYNGEIYNYRELRGTLENKGHQFRSDSDTEVILAAYEEWGTNCVERLHGMFAFVILDKNPDHGKPRAFAARDRLGIKPLLLFEDRDVVWFASQLKALLCVPNPPRKLANETLLEYFAVGSVYQPRTILANVRALPAGYALEIHEKSQREYCYWDLHRATEGLRVELRDIDERNAVQRVQGVLKNAARRHLVADVPVGAFLSGGLDSSAAVSLMTRVTGQSIQTFAVGFEDQQHKTDERRFARKVAQTLGAEHHDVVVTASMAAAFFPQLVDAIDQPSLDGANTWIVSQAARKRVKVSISGLGGDELFAGYPHFHWLAKARKIALPGERRLLDLLVGIRPGRRVFERLIRVSPMPVRLSMLRRLIRDQRLSRTVRTRWRHNHRTRLPQIHERWLPTGADVVQQTSYAELSGYLTSTLLRDSDSMSMAHGLELRPIFLDHELVELAYALPGRLKLMVGAPKGVFGLAVADLVPPEVIHRPKRGFEMPFVSWMAGPLRERLMELLSSSHARGLFTRKYLHGLQIRLFMRRPPRELWAWAVLLAWLEKNNIVIA